MMENNNLSNKRKPKYEKTYCSQCGSEFGPGDHGYSHCANHRVKRVVKTDNQCAHCRYSRWSNLSGRLICELLHECRSDCPQFEREPGADDEVVVKK